MDNRIKEVAFADENLKEAYFKLREGKFEEWMTHKEYERKFGYN